MGNYPAFQNKEWLKEHIFEILRFYYPRCIDEARGGFFNCFNDDGTIPDKDMKHLIGTTRFIYVFSVGALLDGPKWCLDTVKHGIDFLQKHHLDVQNGGYHFELRGLDVVDSTKQVYGHAHVILAASMACLAGVASAKDIIGTTFNLLERHAWREADGLYVDEFNNDWSAPNPYRGQNSNMHLLEAFMAAYEAIGEQKYLKRAVTLAKSVAITLSAQADGLIWDNYYEDWRLDRTNDPKNIWRVYGFLSGHVIEWAKLLVMLTRYCDEEWIVPKAEQLFNAAVKNGWDPANGGLQFSFDFDGSILDSDKHWWVMAEAIGAAAVLAGKTKNEEYREWYEKFWEYSWEHLVDHQYGAWYSVLTKSNERQSQLKSSFHKTDYHPIGACYESIHSL